MGAAICFCLSYSLATCAATAEEDTNKALVRSYLEALGTNAYPPMVMQYHAENYVRTRHELENLFYNTVDDPVISEQVLGHGMRAAFPDRQNTVTRILAQGNLVAATYRITATHQGNLFGIPATGKKIDIDAGAVFKLENGMLVEAWLMAEEAALLRQLDVKLPARQDGKLNLASVIGDVRTFDEALAEHLANPEDTQEYRYTKQLLSYKSLPENRPADYRVEGAPYLNYLRSGIAAIDQRGAELGIEGSHGESMSNRRDMVSTVISDGDLSMMLFRVTAQNTGPLYGIPGSGNNLDNWEMGFARFEGDTWIDGWWFKDELGYLLAIGNEEALNFLVSD